VKHASSERDGPSTGGFVHRDGEQVIDGHGEPVLLRGVGLGNWLLPEGYMWGIEPPGPLSAREIEGLVSELVGPERAAMFWREFRDRFICEDDIARIAAEGMDHVRLPINSRLVMDEHGALQPAGVALVDRLIEWCRAHGLWVVLDLHGAPGGQTGTNIDDSPHGVPELFSSSRYQELTVSLWRQLASRYRDEPVIAGYDLLNEPLPDEFDALYRAELVGLYRELTVAIREVDPNHMIIYEGTHWATNWEIFTEVWDANSMLSFHKYWSPPDRPSIQRFIEIGRSLGLPVYMGEGGENNLDWFQTAFQLYEDCNISWCFWPWKKIETLTSPCSVNAPVGWERVVAYGRTKVDKPDPDEAWRLLTELAQAMALSDCTYRDEVVSALLRRAPVRAPATGFGFRGRGVSYETTAAVPLQGFRSDDSVTIRDATGARPSEVDFHHPNGAPSPPENELVVSLSAGDWVAYDVVLAVAGHLDVAVRIGGRQKSALNRGNRDLPWLDIVVDDAKAELQASGDDHVVLATTTLPIAAGRHAVRVVGRAEETLLHWIEVSPADRGPSTVTEK
jgi:endoglucanase